MGRRSQSRLSDSEKLRLIRGKPALGRRWVLRFKLHLLIGKNEVQCCQCCFNLRFQLELLRRSRSGTLENSKAYFSPANTRVSFRIRQVYLERTQSLR